MELQGVEISFGGQPDTERAALDIKFVQGPGPMSFVHNCSIHDGIGWGIHVLSSKNVSIEDNLFFNCEKFLVRAISSNNYTIIGNLLIAPRKRNLTDTGLYDMVAGIDIFKDQVPKNTGSSFSITRNLVQGGDGNGFVIPGMECGEQNIGFYSSFIPKLIFIHLIFFRQFCAVCHICRSSYLQKQQLLFRAHRLYRIQVRSWSSFQFQRYWSEYPENGPGRKHL